MKFTYRDFGKNRIRPVIRVELSYRNKKIPYDVLVDSGADFCLFDTKVGKLLSIPIKTGEKSEAVGITGFGSPVYIHPVTLTLGKKSFRIKAGFIENMSKVGYGIVGQVGFFDKFEVKFDYQNKEIELTEKKKKARHNLFWSALLKNSQKP